ncbi:MAG: hypothetical protein ACP5IL_02550 [Syntrophobacteraceae bacterium]
MMRMFLIISFTCASVAGLCLITYGLLAGAHGQAGSQGCEKLPLGFCDSPREAFEIFDLNMGHEGLMHRDKERFHPRRHRPERI